MASGFYIGDNTDGRRIVTGLSGVIRAAHVWQRGDQFSLNSREAWLEPGSPQFPDTIGYRQGVTPPGSPEDENTMQGRQGVLADGSDLIVGNADTGFNAGGAFYHWTVWA